jgi:hypothetical protein
VVALIVASSVVALAPPFLIRLVIDEAIPAQDVPLLLWAVGGMLAVTCSRRCSASSGRGCPRRLIGSPPATGCADAHFCRP